jgi:hypothetical protein
MARRRKHTIDDYKTLWDIRCKVVLAGGVLLGFIVVLFAFLNASSWIDIGRYSALEAFLAGTIYVAFKHYFPPVKGK